MEEPFRLSCSGPVPELLNKITATMLMHEIEKDLTKMLPDVGPTDGPIPAEASFAQLCLGLRQTLSSMAGGLRDRRGWNCWSYISPGNGGSRQGCPHSGSLCHPGRDLTLLPCVESYTEDLDLLCQPILTGEYVRSWISQLSGALGDTALVLRHGESRRSWIST